MDKQTTPLKLAFIFGFSGVCLSSSSLIQLSMVKCQNYLEIQFSPFWQAMKQNIFQKTDSMVWNKAVWEYLNQTAPKEVHLHHHLAAGVPGTQGPDF